jgi:hypothetical protein
MGTILFMGEKFIYMIKEEKSRMPPHPVLLPSGERGREKGGEQGCDIPDICCRH